MLQVNLTGVMLTNRIAARHMINQGTGGSNGHTMWTISGVPFTDTFVATFRIIGQGSGNNLRVHVRGQFHVNANGEVTVSDFQFSETCS